MQFNDDQLDGLAKVCDNLATAAIVAGVGTGVLDHKIGAAAVAVLLIGAFILLGIALYLRQLASQTEEDEHGN